MGKIRLLPDEVASQVAAGEVVERPASLVKELVENSVDAGATRIEVEFARGGSQFVTVTDNGCGMDREDALLCLERHATSKIRTGNDLATVATMGFRGEALPSMASVSRFRLVTREHDAQAGTEILVSGGRVESVKDSGQAAGTRVEVRDLFFNLPARRKFLRSEETESARILHQLHALALAHPGTALRCQKDGRAVLQTAAAASLDVRIRDLFGREFLDRLVEFGPLEHEGITLRGFLARPGEGRGDRDQQFVLLNGRAVQCPAVHQPLREAYASVLPKGQHPAAILVIEMDPLTVDCNVHPAKREVRLRHPDVLRRAVAAAARQALENARSGWTKQFESAPVNTPTPAPSPSAPIFHPVPTQRDLPSQELPSPDPGEDRFQLLARMGEKYLLMEGSEGLVLVHLQAAAQRILFEALMREIASGSAPSQRLLLPEVIELPPRDFAWISDNTELLLAAGFQIEPFGGKNLKVEAVPACLGDRDPATLLTSVCDMVRTTGKLPAGRLGTEAIARSVSQLASSADLPRGDDGLRRLVRELLRCDLPYACPLGRPTMIQFSHSELERKFGYFA